MLGLAFLPGFPTAAFLTLAAALGLGSYWASRRQPPAAPVSAGPLAANPSAVVSKLEKPQEIVSAATGAIERLPPRGRLVVWLGRELRLAIPPAAFDAAAERARRQLFGDLGVATPPPQLSVDETTEPEGFRIDLDGVPVAEGKMVADTMMVDAEALQLELLAVPYSEGTPIKREPTRWVQRRHETALAEANIATVAPPDALARHLAHVLRSNATHFIGIQETRALLAAAEAECGELVKESQSVAPLQKLADIMRRLVEEDVPVRNMRLILEAVIEWGKREQDPVLLAEYVRIALRRQICFRCADRNRVIAAYMMSRPVEDLIRSAVRPTAAGSFVSISEAAVRPAIEQIKHMIVASAENARPAVLTSMDVRRHVRTLLVRNDLDLPVLSYQELAPEFHLQALATITGDTSDEAETEVRPSTLEFENAAGH
jgi:type III secretion protein V